MASSSSGKAPVRIVGAGLAGLVAAFELKRHGVPVTVFEASGHVAGLAVTHRDVDGFSYDTGAHFITNRLAAALGMGAQCRDVERYGESVRIGARVHSYPLALLGIPRYVGSALKARAMLEHRDNTVTAAEWFRSRYGRAFADEIALPLLEAWSGAPAIELAASVGAKLKRGVLQTAYLKMASHAFGRAVACGYSHEREEGIHVWHVYPTGGISAICERLAAGLGNEIHRESPVEKIYVDGGRAVGVRSKGNDYAATAVISTAPIHVLPKLVEGTTMLDRFRPFRFRPMIFVNLRFSGRKLLPDVVLWIPDARSPFFRLVEAPLAIPWLAPPGHTIITADIGATVGDAHWTMEDERLGALCLQHLEEIVPTARRRYMGCRVVRTPIAYPVFLVDYEEARRDLEQSTGIENLLSIGRNGEFAHILMEDVYWRTRSRMRALAHRLRAENLPAMPRSTLRSVARSAHHPM